MGLISEDGMTLLGNGARVNRTTTPGGTLTTVPTAAERGGDFSALLSAGNSYQLYNPFSATADASGNETTYRISEK
jgi:hypothetical protein